MPVLDEGRRRGVFTFDDDLDFARVAGRLDSLIGSARDDAPARLHGDLWSGNIMWTGPADAVQAVLIDPAAHVGHRESDLAMLALFGAPHFDEIITGYEAVHRLAPGWRDRLPLHQLYPLAVHAVVFRGGYIAQTRALLAQLAT
jgi:fructosamine-3-kinase